MNIFMRFLGLEKFFAVPKEFSTTSAAAAAAAVLIQLNMNLTVYVPPACMNLSTAGCSSASEVCSINLIAVARL